MKPTLIKRKTGQQYVVVKFEGDHFIGYDPNGYEQAIHWNNITCYNSFSKVFA